LFACVAAGGCLQRIAIDQTTDLLEQAAPAIQEEGDFEFARQAAPPSLLTLQGLWRAAPDSEDLLLQLASGYAAYSLIFLEDDWDQAVDGDDPAEATRLEKRCAQFFLRAQRYGIRLVEQRGEGFRAALRRGPEALKAYLADRDEDDVPALFWTAYAWGAAISHSLDDIELVADLPLVVPIMERVMALEPRYLNGGPITFMATVHATFGANLGGDPEKGKDLFEKALRLQRRRDLLTLVQYAKTYCVSTQDREKFRVLLREVLEAPDFRENRLVNIAAKRRARRLLAREDVLFY
jgi:hypothetical protein